MRACALRRALPAFVLAAGVALFLRCLNGEFLTGFARRLAWASGPPPAGIQLATTSKPPVDVPGRDQEAVRP
jgi:hypothetical protein